ncbi:AAA family ATPase [Alicyclobacillus fodiniaquatilis]|jgi:MoxR-like ATPase|uniref:AAA family ATPase n=1 Tax=Alicyclobacillus fodiniaquatilis TaxID=1661150 RepID=A0ABW4JHB1_9BACL
MTNDQIFQDLTNEVHKQVIGQDKPLRLITAALFASGHVLLEDVPGVGKTTLAKTLAEALRLDFRRVQATPDLLPQDLLGALIYRPQTGDFELRRGPIFTQILLFDEINRATPRTAAALLEAMAENQVSIDGNTDPLNPPFFVMATQNPLESQGVFPLPEAQLDRFLIKVTLGYPTWDEEQSIIRRFRTPQTAQIQPSQPVLDASDILQIQQACRDITVHPDVESYILTIVRTTRTKAEFLMGASPRATLALTAMAQALAFIDGRNYVLPDDVKEAMIPVLGHRVQIAPEQRALGKTEAAMLAALLEEVSVPTEITDSVSN